MWPASPEAAAEAVVAEAVSGYQPGQLQKYARVQLGLEDEKQLQQALAKHLEASLRDLEYGGESAVPPAEGHLAANPRGRLKPGRGNGARLAGLL